LGSFGFFTLSASVAKIHHFRYLHEAINNVKSRQANKDTVKKHDNHVILKQHITKNRTPHKNDTVVNKYVPTTYCY